MIYMDKIVILGGKSLKGAVEISGSKNAVLPIMASTLLADGDYHLTRVPNLRDVKTMCKLLESIGLFVQFTDNQIHIKSGNVEHFEAPYDLVKTMRASIYVLGPMLSRFGQAKVSLPGGCAWGPRPVNLHIEGLEQLGAKIRIENGYIHARAKRLRGARILFNTPSVGATGNLLMAAVLARGTTVLENAAKEPEITALAEFLVQMGAKIDGIGTSRIEVEGVDTLRHTDAAIIPDRIETGTFLAAGHITGSDILLKQVNPDHVRKIMEKLIEAGADVIENSDQIRIKSDGVPRPVNISTAVFPGFPTDMQAQWMALMSTARGLSVITENIYLDRFMHVAELQRLGADIHLDHNVAVVKGVKHLNGAPVMSTDLRASASLILAGLIARGRTDISRVYHIDRGYEQIEAKLKNLGAEIWREKEPLVT